MDFIIEFDYEAQESDELTIKKGDIVKNARIHEDGWMIGSLNGKEGVFPDNFGKEYKEKEPSKKDSIDDSNKESNTTDDELEEGPKKKKVMGVGFGNIFAGEQIKLKSAKIGEMRPKSSDDEKLDVKVQNPKVTEQVRVKFKYVADNKDELNLEVDEIITVVNKETGDDGWWLGRNSSGKSGVFPDNYVEPLKEKNHDESSTAHGTNLALNSSISGHPPKPFSKPNKTPPPTTAPKPTPMRPQPLDPKVLANKPRGKGNSLDESGVSFETDPSHKPLVGPTAGRARGPGKKPKTIGNLNTPDEEDSKPSPNQGVSKTLSISHSFAEKHHAPPPPATSSSTTTTTNTTPVTSTTLSHSLSSKPKQQPQQINKEKTFNSTEDIIKATESTQVHAAKSNSLTRQHHESVTLNHDSNNNKTTTSTVLPKDEREKFNAQIGALEKRVASLEESNVELSHQLSEQKRTQTDQISLLTSKVQKLIRELDEEKSKKASFEIELKRIKTSVEDVENTLLKRGS